MSAAEVGHKYIIVGGGTAGCVLANRLSADKVIHLRLQAGMRLPGEWYSSSSAREDMVLTRASSKPNMSWYIVIRPFVRDVALACQ